MASLSKSSQYVQPWHFDCRLSKELPDDNPVRGSFLAILFSATIAVVALFYTGITLYSHSMLGRDIASWQDQARTNGPQMAELQKVIASIQSGAHRLDEIHKLTNTPLPVSDFIQDIGRTRPANVRIDMIEFHDGAVYIRGGLQESSQRASALLNQYIAELRANPRLRPMFQTISLTAMDPNAKTGTMNFEINLKLKPVAP